MGVYVCVRKILPNQILESLNNEKVLHEFISLNILSASVNFINFPYGKEDWHESEVDFFRKCRA